MSWLYNSSEAACDMLLAAAEASSRFVSCHQHHAEPRFLQGRPLRLKGMQQVLAVEKRPYAFMHGIRRATRQLK